MARRKGGFFAGLMVVVLIVACAFFGYKYYQYKNVDEQGNHGASNDTWLTVIETNVEYRQGSTTIDMLKGVIKTNEQVEKIYVNINGIGTQYLEFTPSLIQTTNSAYVANNITPLDGLCSVGVAETQTVTVDLYVEYGGRSFKVDTQKVEVVSSTFKVLRAEIEYSQGSTSIDLKGGVIKANAQVDKIFVNINGVGTQYLEFASTGEYEYTIEAVDDICATVFDSDTTIIVDLYVEHGGRCYKVETQEVSVRSCWTKNY